jgi:hypothetical protein
MKKEKESKVKSSYTTRALQKHYKGISDNEAVEEYKERVGNKVKNSQYVDKVVSNANSLAQKGASLGLSLGDKVLGTAHQKIQSRDVLKALKQSQGYRLVREVDKPEVKEDKRSLFFKGEVDKERKWLS